MTQTELILPPHTIEAEEAVLGGILLDPHAMERVADRLHPDCFYITAHQHIYRAAHNLYTAGQPTDLLTVTNWLTDHKLLDQVGGKMKMAQLVDTTVSAVNVDALAELIIGKHVRRRLLQAAHEISRLAQDGSKELTDVLDGAEQHIFEISTQKLKSNTEENLTVALSAYDFLDAESEIYPTGLYDLDKLIVGLEPGTLNIVAGRPSMGKSQIALFLAHQMLLLHSLPVAFFSLEMSKRQLEYRLWSLISDTPTYKEEYKLRFMASDRIRRHKAKLEPLKQSEYENIFKIVEIASQMPLYLNDDRAISVASIASECRQIKAKQGKLGLVVVDYLQMMAEESGGNRSYELGDVARGLYKLSSDLEVPVLALSQISRGVEQRNNKRPMMSDLSQSGILEMVADNIIFAYRDEYYNPDTPDRNILELIVGKARHGETGTAAVLFDKSCGVIRNFKQNAE